MKGKPRSKSKDDCVCMQIWERLHPPGRKFSKSWMKYVNFSENTGGEDMTTQELSEAIDVPEGTIMCWVHKGWMDTWMEVNPSGHGHQRWFSV